MSVAAAGSARAQPVARSVVVALVVLLFLGLGVAYTWPLTRHLTAALPFAAVPPEGRETLWRAQGDYLQFYYYLWLVRDRLLEGASILRDPYQFRVDGPRWNLPNTFLPVALLFLPLSAGGPVLGYNLLVLLSFPLAGLSVTLLARRYGVSPAAAVVGGVIFACVPYRVGVLLGGHPAGIAYFLVPLCLWGLEGALAGSVAGAAWAAVALVSLAMVEPHFFYFAGLGLPLYLLGRVGLHGWTPAALDVGGRAWLAALLVAAAPAAAVLARLERQGFTGSAAARVTVPLVVLAGALAVWQAASGWLRAAGVETDARAAARRSLLACVPWLGGLAALHPRGGPVAAGAFFLPLLLHLGWIAAAWRRWSARLPWVPLALAGAGAAAGAAFMLLLKNLLLVRSVSGAGRSLHEVLLFSPLPEDLWRRVNPNAARAIYPGLLALALAGLGVVWLARRLRAEPDPRRRALFLFVPLLALALTLCLGPRLPQVPLFEVAFRLVPTWNFIRQPAKFQVLGALALALLAALGTEALASRLRRRAGTALVAFGLAGLVAIEYHPWRPAGLSMLPAGGPAHDGMGAAGPRVLFVPLWPGDSAYSGLYLHTTTLTRVPMLNGYSAWLDRSYLPGVYRPLEPLNLGVVGAAEHAALRRLQVRQVVLDPEAFPLKVSPFGPAFTRAGLATSPFLDAAPLPADDTGPLWRFAVRDMPTRMDSPRPAPSPRSPLGVYWEAESLSRETGRVTAAAGASNGRVIEGRAGRDRPGFLVHGPYRMLPPGPFRATFRVSGRGSRLTLQVTAEGGRRVLAEAAVSPGEAGHDVALEYSLDRPAAVEYRARWDGEGTATVDAVAVRFADVPDPAPEFEVEALGHDLIERADREASGGWAGYADPARTPRDRVWSGPLRAYPAGRYRLWVRLKLDRATEAAVLHCAAQAASGGPGRGGRDIRGAEAAEPGRYVEVAVAFAIPRAEVLELPCAYRGTAPVWLDRLRVEGPLAS